MQVSKDYTEPTKVKLTVMADQTLLDETKEQVLEKLAAQVRLPGFRAGKAPLNLVEKNVDQSLLQTEFLEQVVNRLYIDAINQEHIRPVASPEVNVTKFVPFTTVEFEASVDVVGEIKLPDYKKIKIAKKPVKVAEKDIDDVIAQLSKRAADKKEVERVAHDGDEVLIDFKGTDAKTGEAISGADGKDYPLILGSKTFIPGFEDNLVGVKPGETKSFTLEFPKDYGVKALQSRNVTFEAKVSKISEVIEPKIDNKFASKVGPFKTVTELRADIKRQLETERQNEADRDFENQLIEKIAEKSEVAIPEALIKEELDVLERQEKQNLIYRGQTWQEHLESEGVTEQQHRDNLSPQATTRVKAGLVLAEIGAKEKIEVAPEELEIRLQLLKGQYTDEKMQAELNNPENRREIAARMATEKTIARLTEYATAK